MNRSQIIILAISIVLALGMYQLPRAVVRKKEEKKTTQQKPVTEDQHQAKLSDKQRQKLIIWKKALQTEKVIEKRRIFADSIAMLFRSVNKIDSAAVYYEEALAGSKTLQDRFLIADTWFEAFNFALDAERMKLYAEKARKLYEEIVAENPKQYKAKVNLALTYTASNEPMKPALMLREVLAEQPTNELALFAIGNLSIQSGQFEKAVARFDTLLKINPNHLEAKLGLAQSLWKQKAPNKERAKELLKEIIALKADSLALYRQVAQETLDNLSKE